MLGMLLAAGVSLGACVVLYDGTDATGGFPAYFTFAFITIACWPFAAFGICIARANCASLPIGFFKLAGSADAEWKVELENALAAENRLRGKPANLNELSLLGLQLRHYE